MDITISVKDEKWRISLRDDGSYMIYDQGDVLRDPNAEEKAILDKQVVKVKGLDDVKNREALLNDPYSYKSNQP